MQMYRIEREKKNNFPKYLAVIIITAVLTLYVDRTIGKANEIDEFAQKLAFEENENKQNESLIENDEEITDVEDILESTVGISLVKPTGDSVFELDMVEKWGIGTGVIVSESGYILTNQHVAQNEGAKISVTLNSRKNNWGENCLDGGEYRFSHYKS